MFYPLLKAYARLAIRIYCRRIIINQRGILKQNGPLLLACNHPNSFLDGMILTTLFDHPVHSLARGDAFKKKWMSRLLRSIRLLPVYRTSEGVENLEHNYTTFAACQETFKENGIVLIFSEGRCENEWHLRPLRKGTARLAVAAWKNEIPLMVVPTALNYSSFHRFGKDIHIFFSEAISSSEVLREKTEGKQLLAFNEQLNKALKNTVYEIDPSDGAGRKKIFGIKKQSPFYLLLLPAFAGWLLHLPFFYACTLFTRIRFNNSGHFDSVQTSLLLLIYPFYLLILVLCGFYLISWWSLLILVLAPLLAKAAVEVKYQADL